MPRPLLLALGGALGALVHAAARPLRRDGLAGLARAFPTMPAPERAALLAATFRALGTLLGETVALFRTSRSAALLPAPEEGLGPLRQAVAEGRGVVFASAHLGPWERVAATLVAAGVPLVAVGRESYDPALTHVYKELRDHLGVPCIFRGEPGSGARMLRVLRRGEVLALPMDLRSRVPSVVVPFLGHPAPTPVGPARLALLRGAAVVVGTVAPGGDGRLVVTTTRVATNDLRSGAEGERILTGRINAELSRRIQALPHLWVWPHRRWGTAGS